MSARIVGVHGIGNRQRGATPDQAAAALGTRWSSALRRGLGQDSDLQAVVAYYAHHLATDTAQGAGDPEHLTEAEQQMQLRWAAELGAPPEVAQGRLAAPARAAADWIARKVGLDSKLVRLLVTTFCREVHLYLTDPARRHAVRDEVADTIAAHQPAAVIAHSLGSVVTYETLCVRSDLQIDLLITLGSPLALPDVVFPQLDPAPTNGIRTPTTRRPAVDQHRRPRRLHRHPPRPRLLLRRHRHRPHHPHRRLRHPQGHRLPVLHRHRRHRHTPWALKGSAATSVAAGAGWCRFVGTETPQRDVEPVGGAVRPQAGDGRLTSLELLCD